jgi:hypothetical protein
VIAGAFGAFDDQRLRRASRLAQNQRDRGLRDAISLDRYAARRRKPLIEFPADHLEIVHLYSLVTRLRRIETTSRPPKAVSATVIPHNTNPARPVSFSSFCIVEARAVASSRYSIGSLVETGALFDSPNKLKKRKQIFH